MVITVKNIMVKPLTLTKVHEVQVCNKKLSHCTCSNLMKFIVIYGQIENEKQDIGCINHSRNEKKST